MSKRSKPKHSRFTESSKEKSALQHDTHHRYDDDDELDEEDDHGIPVTPTGSVLMPSPQPYNMLEKIKEANEKLEEEKKSLEVTKRNPKVRFVEPLSIDEDEFLAADQSLPNPDASSRTESKPSKILLVTVPTAYSIDSEEILTDDDYEDDLDFNNDDFRGTRNCQESSIAKFYEYEEVDTTLPLTEETLTSSLETVLYRSETEESELTECFTKGINLNTETELLDSVSFDSDKIIDYKESLCKADDLIEDVIETLENIEMKKEKALSVNLGEHPTTADTGKTQILSSSKTVKAELSASKSPCKLRVNTLSKKNAALNPRPSTAPVKRACCKMGIMAKLPAYNGLRSEYGLSKEQLLEREKKKYELSKVLKIEKEKKWLEERQKQKENEIKFKNWLIKKKKEAELKTLRRLQQSNYCFRTIQAPTSHLDKIGILRRKMLKQESTCLLLDEIFRNAKPQEQKTYRIYLGLCV